MQVSPVRAHRRHGPATCVLRHLRHHKRAGRIASRRRSIGAGFRRKTAFLGSTRTNSRSRAGPPDTGFSSQGGGRVSPSSGALHGPTPSAPSKSPPVRRRGVCGRCGASREPQDHRARGRGDRYKAACMAEDLLRGEIGTRRQGGPRDADKKTPLGCHGAGVAEHDGDGRRTRDRPDGPARPTARPARRARRTGAWRACLLKAWPSTHAERGARRA